MLLALFALGALAVIALPHRAMGYVKGLPTQIELAPIGRGFYLRSDAAQAFSAMAAAASGNGVDLVKAINSAFRTYAEQERLYLLYKAGTGNLASPPGYGNHQAGIDVDLESANGTNATYKWLVANALRFKFVNTGAHFSQAEPWHWEYQA